jgi:hypothetical protein
MPIELSSITFTEQGDLVPQPEERKYLIMARKYLIMASLILLLETI